MSHSQLINFKQNYFILWVLCIIGSMSVIPYALSMRPDGPTPNIMLMLAQNVAIYALIVWLGLKISLKTFQIHLMTRNLNWRNWLLVSCLSGFSLGMIMVGLDQMIFKQFVNPSIYATATQIPTWQSLLSCLYGGINEEVLLRLFFMGGLAWIFSKFTKNRTTSVMLALCFSTLLFGAGHLPILYRLIAEPTWIDITRIIVLNSIGGISFGILFWKKGFEYAMVAHFTADIALHVIF